MFLAPLLILHLNTGLVYCTLSAGVPRGDTPGEGDGEGGPDGERSGTVGTGGVGGGPTSAGREGGVSGGVGSVGRGDSPATGTGVGPGGAVSVVGGTPKPPKGAFFHPNCYILYKTACHHLYKKRVLLYMFIFKCSVQT